MAGAGEDVATICRDRRGAERHPVGLAERPLLVAHRIDDVEMAARDEGDEPGSDGAVSVTRCLRRAWSI